MVDPVTMVRVTYAENIALLAETALRFLLFFVNSFEFLYIVITFITASIFSISGSCVMYNSVFLSDDLFRPSRSSQCL